MQDIINLIDIIYTMHGNSLAEKILDYCETYDKDPKEIGDLLEESEDFKELLYRDCLKHNIINDDDMEKDIDRTEEIEVW